MSDKYFWQLIFIKYTQDNKRAFYPNFFSNGYFITSEEQMINYRKYGNKFFIVCLFLLYLMFKLKVIKLLLKLHLVNFWYILIIFGIIIFAGIIYNIAVEKIIFRYSPKIEEKFWENNSENTKFILQTAGNFILFIGLLGGLIYLCLKLITQWYFFIAAIIGIVIICWLYDKNQKGHIQEYVSTLEYTALSSYSKEALNKLTQDNFSEKSNQYKIIENTEKYIPDLLDYLIKNYNYTYENEIKNIDKYITELKNFNENLYEKDIPEDEHIKIIEEEFLPNFEFINTQG